MTLRQVVKSQPLAIFFLPKKKSMFRRSWYVQAVDSQLTDFREENEKALESETSQSETLMALKWGAMSVELLLLHAAAASGLTVSSQDGQTTVHLSPYGQLENITINGEKTTLGRDSGINVENADILFTPDEGSRGPSAPYLGNAQSLSRGATKRSSRSALLPMRVVPCAGN